VSAANNGGPALPRAPFDVNDYVGDGSEGMTLRDWFAGESLDIASTLEHAHPTGSEGQPTYAGIATRAYYMADAMLAARKQ